VRAATTTRPPNEQTIAAMGADVTESAHLAALLRSAHAGRPGAWDELARACRPLVERQARKHAWSNSDAEDIAQEVWLRLMRHGDRIRDPNTLVGWLAVVSRRLAAEVGHRNARSVPTEFADEEVGVTSTEDDALVRHDRRMVCHGVRRALSRLNETDRELVLLLHEDGAPNYRAISRRVSRPVGSLGPTRRRLLDRLGRDPAVRQLQFAAV
jgi:RNA polymerase sigma factor (sigma-70 family)